jgi:1-pyrroline-5-carboxylate dehydrogenase
LPFAQSALIACQHHYAKGSAQREGLTAALEALQKKAPLDVPIVIGGKAVSVVIASDGFTEG